MRPKPQGANCCITNTHEGKSRVSLVPGTQDHEICIKYKIIKSMIFTNDIHRTVVALLFKLGIRFIMVFTNNNHKIAVTI